MDKIKISSFQIYDEFKIFNSRKIGFYKQSNSKEKKYKSSINNHNKKKIYIQIII